MADGVIVLDPNNIIIDINPAAKAMIGMEKSHSFLGLTLREALADYADIIDQFKGKTDYSTEIKISEDPPRYLGFSVTTIRDSQKNDLGEIIVLFDITERKLIEAQEDEQRKLAEALANTAGVINSTLNLDEVLEKILENVDKVVPHDAANIALIDANNNVRFVKIKGYGKYGTEEIVQSIECCVDEISNLHQMAETHKASFNPNTDSDPEWNRNVQGSSWIKSYMGAPICAKGQLIGFINLDAETPYFFKKEYIPRLEAFANQAAVAIQNAQYFREIAESAQEMSILYEVGMAATSGLGVEKTVSTLFNQIKAIIPIDLFFIALMDDQKENAIYTMLQKDGQKIDFGPVSMKDRPSMTRYVLEKGKTVYIPDIKAKDAEFSVENMVHIPGFTERSSLGIPLILRDEVHGAMFLLATMPNAFTQDQIRLIETIANQASIVIDNAQLFEKVQVMAITDSLTGAYNRRYFFTSGESEIIRAQRYGSALSLIMLDIDHFKLVNDHFGHPVGDKTLIMVTQACSAVLRKVDILCRFGGEEFVVLLPETALDAAVIAAERIRQAISEQRLPTENGEVKVTVSIGVAELQAKTETLENLVDKSDKALYQAKGEGRNCVRVYKP
jgi:diguanylate cyclase (GGDEF)-like protein/PAS domain S-box-containing protein